MNCGKKVHSLQLRLDASQANARIGSHMQRIVMARYSALRTALTDRRSRSSSQSSSRKAGPLSIALLLYSSAYREWIRLDYRLDG